MSNMDHRLWKRAICLFRKNNNFQFQYQLYAVISSHEHPESKVHGANMGPIWGRQDPGGPHVGPVNFAICSCMVTMQRLPHKDERCRIYDYFATLPKPALFLFSIHLKDHRRENGVMFHNLGLSGSNYVHKKGWSLKTLCTIMRELGHDGVSPRVIIMTK